MLSLLILILFYCARKPTPDTHVQGTTHMQTKCYVENSTTCLKIAIHLRSGRFSLRCMFHIKFTQYSDCSSCLQRDPQSGSSLMPPAKPSAELYPQDTKSARGRKDWTLLQQGCTGKMQKKLWILDVCITHPNAPTWRLQLINSY